MVLADNGVALQRASNAVLWGAVRCLESRIDTFNYGAINQAAIVEAGAGVDFGFLIDHYLERRSHVQAIMVLDVDGGVDASCCRAAAECARLERMEVLVS